jgi:hypothetical protein
MYALNTVMSNKPLICQNFKQLSLNTKHKVKLIDKQGIGRELANL